MFSLIFKNKVSDLVSEVFQKLHQFYINSEYTWSKFRQKVKSKKSESTGTKAYKIYFNNEVQLDWGDDRSIVDLVEDSIDNLKTAFKIVIQKRKNFTDKKIKSKHLDMGIVYNFEEYFDKYLEREEINGYNCQGWHNNQGLKKQVWFEQCPQYLIIILKRFENHDGVIIK